MAIDVKDRQAGAEGDELDPAQQHFDDVFNDLTSQEHMAKDGVPGDTGGTEAEKEGLFSPDGEQPGNSAPSGASNGGGVPAITNRLGPDMVNRLASVFWAKQNRRRTTVAGTLIGLTLGGGILGSTFLAGPLGFMQIAHTIEQTHFSSNEDASSNRLIQIYRFIKYNKTGELHRTRMGALGNKYADRVEARLNSIGLSSEYSPRLGLTKTGLKIDRNAPEYKNKTADQIKQELKEQGITVIGDDSTGLRIDSKSMGFRQTRSFYRGLLRETGENLATSAIQAHVMGERDGVTWHPLKRLDNKVLSSVEEWWVNRAKTIENGAEPTVTGTEDQTQKDENGKPVDQNATDSATAAKDAAQQTLDQAGQAGGDAIGKDPEAVSKFSDSLKSGATKAAGVTAFGIGLACIARQVAMEAPAIKEAQVNLPLIRMSMEAVSVGAEMTFGGGDVEPAELAKLSQQWFSSKNHTSWSQAQPVQAAAGQKQDGPAPSDTLKSIADGSPFDAFKNGALGPICNPVTQGVLGVVGFLGGPVSASVSTLIGFFAEPKLVDALAHWAAGKAIDPVPRGADYGYDGMYGGRLAANEQALSQGGVELSPASEGALTAFETSAQKTDFEQQSIAYRIFNPVDIHSVVGSMLSHESPSTTSNIASMTAGFASLGRTLASLPGTLFSSMVSAGTPSSYDYGFPKYGFSLDEMQQASEPGSPLENPFANGDHAAAVLDTPCTDANGKTQHPCGQDYIDAAKVCFHMDIVSTPNSDGSNMWDAQASTDPINTFSDDYKKAHCTSPSNTNSSDWLSVRFFVFDTQTMKSEACYDGDSQSCTDEGVSSSSSDTAATPTPSTGVSKPTIVLDPGHAPDQSSPSIDQATNIVVTDYENEPEMQQMYDLATTYIQPKLAAAGYNVIITKDSLNSYVDLKQRADVANTANAALAVSLHTSPGGSDQNLVFYPKVGEYRYTADGSKAPAFNDSALASKDQNFAELMASARQQTEGTTVKAGAYGDVFGFRTIKATPPNMQKGNILTVQYFSKVPWVYNEHQAPPKGSGAGPLSQADMQKYADGVIKGIEAAVPVGGGQ